jgi:hypothetical protein
MIPCVVFIRTDYERALTLPIESGCMIDYLYNEERVRVISGDRRGTIPDKRT